MVKKLVSVALLAGLLGGIGATVFQLVYVVPLILEAETYELTHAPRPAASDAHADHGHGHAHGDEEAWAPADGLERIASTAAANIFAGMGFALLLLAAMHLRGDTITGRTGLIWGSAGFVSFSLAPFFGLPPELPGMVGAALESRQIWWTATVVLTASGLWLMTSRSARFSGVLKVVLGLLLIVLPHAFGAPQLMDGLHMESALPAHLSSEFAVAVLAHGLILWLALGFAVGWLYRRFDLHQPSLPPSAQSPDPA